MEIVNAFYRFSDQPSAGLKITVTAVVALALLSVALMVREGMRRKMIGRIFDYWRITVLLAIFASVIAFSYLMAFDQKPPATVRPQIPDGVTY